MLRALMAEGHKLRHSYALLWTAVVVCLMPLIPVTSAKLTGNELAGATWEQFMRAGPEMLAGAWGILVFGFVVAYLFGREYEEGTLSNVFTLPLRREYAVAAKLLVAAGWVAALTVLSVPVQMGYATLLGLDGFAWTHVWTALAMSLEACLLIYLTLPVVAWLAVIGRGYLLAMLFSALMMASGLMLAMGGWVRWVPWSMPMAVAGAAFTPSWALHRGLGPESWAIAVATFIIALVVLVMQIDFADNG